MIKVYYKDEFLGTFEKKANGYVYNSSQTEKQAAEKYFLKISAYSKLLNSKNAKFDTLPRFFQETADQIKQRGDLIAQAGILPTDDDFAKIEKYAKLDQYKQNFHFVSEN